MPFAATIRPRNIGTSRKRCARSVCLDKLTELLRIARGNVNEIEARRPLGQRGQELTLQISVDRNHSDEQGQPQPEGDDNAGRECARAMDVGDGEPNDGSA